MPSSRIKVKYTPGRGLTVCRGQTFWLDEQTGDLYKSEHDPVCPNAKIKDAQGKGYSPAGQGIWRNTSYEVCDERHWALYGLERTRDPKSDSAVPSSYPDGNPKSAQGAKKYDLMYLPLPAKIEVNRALEDGAKKYGKANWRETGVSVSVYLNAAARHIDQYNEGQRNASDSSVHNLGHAMACLAIIIDAEANGKLIEDRPLACVDTDALLKRSITNE